MEMLELLQTWSEAVKEAEAAKAVIERERELRKKLFESVFVTPVEGVNKFKLPHDWTLKANYKLERKIDETAIEHVVENMSKKFGIDGYMMIKYKAELVTKVFKGLTMEQQTVFSEALIIKPQSPELELIAPKPENT